MPFCTYYAHYTRIAISEMLLVRFGNPDDIASAVSFLASNDSSFVTGIELSVDGGMAQI
jgi:NAD(P)-dependent dehydrogenase (short-subunit alcohol dehydrogenase family)